MILLGGGVSSVLKAETIFTFGFKDGVPPAFGNSAPAGGFALEVASPNKLGRPCGNGSAFGIRAGSFACQPGFSGLPRGASGGANFIPGRHGPGAVCPARKASNRACNALLDSANSGLTNSPKALAL